jgi:hypothetical protein
LKGGVVKAILYQSFIETETGSHSVERNKESHKTQDQHDKKPQGIQTQTKFVAFFFRLGESQQTIGVLVGVLVPTLANKRLERDPSERLRLNTTEKQSVRTQSRNRNDKREEPCAPDEAPSRDQHSFSDERRCNQMKQEFELSRNKRTNPIVELNIDVFIQLINEIDM